MNKSVRGFTLIELAIVLVVIGLVVAGIVSGRNLVDAAKFRKMIGETNSITAAFAIFQSNYDALPGDFNNAYSYWPTCGGASAATCNGNDDKRILMDTTGDAVTDPYSEVLLVWNHLSLAGLIPGSYDASPGSCANDHCALVGINVPAAPFTGVGYFVTTGTNLTALFIGKQWVPSTEWNYDSWATPLESYNVDRKIDDGLPTNGLFRASGIVGAYIQNFASCYTGSSYNVSNISRVCGGTVILRGPLNSP